MFRKLLSLSCPVLALSVAGAAPAAANILERAAASVDCTGYTLRAVAEDLSPGASYTIDYGFTATAQGVSTPITGTINFTAAASTSLATGSGSWNLAANFTTLAGSATLTSSGSTAAIVVNGSVEADGAARLNCAPGSWSQQGPRLVGTGAKAGPGLVVEQGNSVSMSADGGTAAVGGPGDDNGVGAAWVFAFRNGAWRQEGGKLVGAGAAGAAGQGYSVALAADGKTLLVGGPLDNPAGSGGGAGAAWVFARVDGVWQQQAELLGTGAVGPAEQGWSVALAADGNTAVIGGPDDDGQGAAWVFVRTGGAWQQQGAKLVGSGAVGDAFEGSSVALSADGNTAIVGGPDDNLGHGGPVGAAWVFTRSGGAWRQQGAKLVGSGAVGDAFEGASVALSADGNTAILGGPGDDTVGAVWVFARATGVWQQDGRKLVGANAKGAAGQGSAVALSGDGDTAVVGGFGDDGGIGAAWAFTRSARGWRQQGPKLVGTGTKGEALVGASVSLSGDGQTVVLGGPGDLRVGAARIFAAADPVAAFSGTPGQADCYPKGMAALLRRFRGLAAAAAGLGFSGTAALQNAVLADCRE